MHTGNIAPFCKKSHKARARPTIQRRRTKEAQLIATKALSSTYDGRKNRGAATTRDKERERGREIEAAAAAGSEQFRLLARDPILWVKFTRLGSSPPPPSPIAASAESESREADVSASRFSPRARVNSARLSCACCPHIRQLPADRATPIKRLAVRVSFAHFKDVHDSPYRRNMMKSVMPQESASTTETKVIRLTTDQESVLQAQFNRWPKNPHHGDVVLLAAETGLSEEDVQDWYTYKLAQLRKEQGLGGGFGISPNY